MTHPVLLGALLLLVAGIGSAPTSEPLSPPQLLASLGLPPDLITTLGSLESVSTLAKLTDSSLKWDFGVRDPALRRRLLVSFGGEPPDHREKGYYVVIAVTMDGGLVGLDGMTGDLLWNKTLPEAFIRSSSGTDLIPSLLNDDHRIFSYDASHGMQAMHQQKQQSFGDGKSLALGRDAQLILTDTHRSQMLALDPYTGMEQATGPAVLLSLDRKSVHMMEPALWTVQWNATVSKVSSSSIGATERKRAGGLLAPAMMASRGSLVALHPITAAPLWQLQLEGTVLSVLTYNLKQQLVQSTLDVESDLVILCRGNIGPSQCDGLVISTQHRHLLPFAPQALPEAPESIFVLETSRELEGSVVAVPNPEILIVNTPSQQQLQLTQSQETMLSLREVAELDSSAISTKLLLRKQLAQLGVATGRVPTKWGGSKALETATTSELKWVALRLLRQKNIGELTDRIQGGAGTGAGASAVAKSSPAHTVVPWRRGVMAPHLGLHWVRPQEPNVAPPPQRHVPAIAASATHEASTEGTEEAVDTFVSTVLGMVEQENVFAGGLLVAGVLLVALGWRVNLRRASNTRKRKKRRRASAPIPAPMVATGEARNVTNEAKETKKVDVLEDRECVVCADEEAICCLYPCGHRCVCQECGKLLQTQKYPCPICRVPINDVLRVWE